jgi:hypothetical protein
VTTVNGVIRSPAVAALVALLLCLALPQAAQAVEPGVVIGPNTTVDEVANTGRSGATWVRLFVDRSQFDENHFASRVRAFKAANVNVLIVISFTPAHERPAGTGNNHPPNDPSGYGDFFAYLGQNHGEFIDAYEVWNEPDDKVFFHDGPKPQAYVPLLKAAYDGVQKTDPTAFVVTGGMVGNDFDFLDDIYDLGGKGYFDAVGVHTDLACEKDAPEFQYRDEQGRIGRYVFTGYREVAATMADHGESKPVWMTEMGWPTPGENVTCMFGGKPMPGMENEPGGVSLEQQAKFLTRGMQCMQGDGIVSHAFWFSLQDVSRSDTHEDRFGLIDAAGRDKPAFGAMQDWARSRSGTSDCGEPVDRTPPELDLQFPPDNFEWAGPLTVKAVARDNLRMSHMQLEIDGKEVAGRRNGDTLALEPWYGASDLARGTHRLVVKAYDGAKNVASRAITVKKVDASDVKGTMRAKLSFTFKKKRGLKVSVCAKVSAPAGAPFTPGGKVRVFMDIKRKRKWVRFTKLTQTVANGICETRKLRKAGKWRVWARYVAVAPYRNARSKYHFVRARG